MNRHFSQAIFLLALPCLQQAALAFTTVYNVPPDIAPTVIGSNTQLNLFDGGVIGPSFDAGTPVGPNTNIEVNISGGSTGFGLDVFSGATLNISGGTVGDSLEVFSGGVVHYTGGTVGQNFTSASGGSVAIIGGEFVRNGVPISGSTTVSSGTILTGTLADGTVIVLVRDTAASETRDTFPSGTLTLATTSLPAAPSIVNSPVDSVPRGLRAGQTLTLGAGANTIENFAGVDATLNLAGGSIARGLELVGTDLNLTQGSIGDRFHMFAGSTLNMSGGTIGNDFRSLAGTQINLSGGTVGQQFRVYAGSTIDITGGEFELDGVPVTGTTNFPSGSKLLTGTLADGSVFIFDRSFASVNLNTVSLPSAPSVINSPTDPAPKGLRAGQTLNLGTGASVGDNFATVDATVNMTGGTIGNGLEVLRTNVTIDGGIVGQNVLLHAGSHLGINDGQVGSIQLSDAILDITGGIAGYFRAESNSVVNIRGGDVAGGVLSGANNSIVTISGGNISAELSVFAENTLNIAGGSINGGVTVYSDSVVNISGGDLNSNFRALSGQVNILGRSFFIDGVEITDDVLVNGSLPITERNVTLSGLYRDGTPFSYFLNSSPSLGGFYAETLVVAIPEPSTLLLCLAASMCAYSRRRLQS